MEASIVRLKLHGKIVLVLDQSFESLAVSRYQHSRSIATCRHSRHLYDFVTNTCLGRGRRVIRKIRSQKSTPTGNRVAIGTIPLAEENLPAVLCIPTDTA